MFAKFCQRINTFFIGFFCFFFNGAALGKEKNGAASRSRYWQRKSAKTKKLNFLQIWKISIFLTKHFSPQNNCLGWYFWLVSWGPYK